jgi:hypothetical protein
VPEQTLVPPPITAGCNGVEVELMVIVLAGLVPQLLVPVTVIAPLVVLEVMVILLLVLVPDQPAGKFQV